jgi:hypothetical protein
MADLGESGRCGGPLDGKGPARVKTWIDKLRRTVDMDRLQMPQHLLVSDLPQPAPDFPRPGEKRGNGGGADQ